MRGCGGGGIGVAAVELLAASVALLRHLVVVGRQICRQAQVCSLPVGLGLLASQMPYCFCCAGYCMRRMPLSSMAVQKPLLGRWVSILCNCCCGAK